jgi:phosphonate transport system substrate-binding protein
VVHKDSPIQSLEELRNQQLAFPSPAAFAASILPRAHMKSLGLNIGAQYVSSHDSVYRNVAKGIYPAGGGVMRTFKAITPDISSQLRVLWKTNEFTSHAIAVHVKLEQDNVFLIRDALLSMNENEAGRLLLKGIGFKGMETAKDERWGDVRALNIELLK